ncbi:hypothetical protein BDZ97DRAFT_1900993 [Flammula alnicola]|nr:hypothetical protein BDZ97DRAFT_1900993 [Flammula alnicola]
MSTETTSRKKRNTSESTPVPDGDHRKRSLLLPFHVDESPSSPPPRRRNRTTQSCLNCHTSKRMCDRKRPACARCTQLGLTGLCVYEVDDPSQRTETQDESSRLLKRVAELEGVIRELKNKPHPRWVQSAGLGEELEKWHSRPLGGSDESCSSNAPSPPISSSSSEKGDSSSSSNASTHSKSFDGSMPAPIHLQSGSESSRRMRSPFSPSSPFNSSSPGLRTPTDDFPFSPVGIAGQGSVQDYDITSMFLNYPGLMEVGDGSFSALPEHRFSKQSTGQCGCVNEPTSYNHMLELSLRLRKASDVLGRSPSHQHGVFCPLHQRISELDSFTTNVLSDISTSGLPSSHLHHSMQAGFHPSQMYSQRLSQAPRGSMNGRPWDLIPSNSNSPASLDDSFMTWEPPHITRS